MDSARELGCLSRPIRFQQLHSDNLTVPKRESRGLQVPLKSFDIPQKWFESRVILLEEVRRRPQLPLAMREAGQAFAYEFNDIEVSLPTLSSRT